MTSAARVETTHGREGHASGRNIPELKLGVEFTLGDERATVGLWKVRHPEWFLMMGVMDASAKSLVARGAKVTAIVLEGGPSVREEQLDFNSLCVFRDPKRPLSPSVRPEVCCEPNDLATVSLWDGKAASVRPFPNRSSCTSTLRGVPF